MTKADKSMFLSVITQLLEGWPFIALLLQLSSFYFLYSFRLGWGNFDILSIILEIGPSYSSASWTDYFSADGIVQMITEVSPPVQLDMAASEVRISVFMNVFDCHVNRAPCDGKLDGWSMFRKVFECIF